MEPSASIELLKRAARASGCQRRWDDEMTGGGGGDGGGDDPGAMNYDEQLDAQFHLHAPLKILAVNLWCPIHLEIFARVGGRVYLVEHIPEKVVRIATGLSRDVFGIHVPPRALVVCGGELAHIKQDGFVREFECESPC